MVQYIFLADVMICGGKLNKDACGGDSGGPLIANIDGKFTLVGVTSWGIGCGAANSPGVYADISHPSMMRFINWPMSFNGIVPNPLPNPSRAPPGRPNGKTPMCQPNAGTVNRRITFKYDRFDSQASVISTSQPRRNNGNRIIGGDDANPGEVPWQVNLLIDGTQLENLRCGGTLVSTTVRF